MPWTAQAYGQGALLQLELLLCERCPDRANEASVIFSLLFVSHIRAVPQGSGRGTAQDNTDRCGGVGELDEATPERHPEGTQRRARCWRSRYSNRLQLQAIRATSYGTVELYELYEYEYEAEG